MKRIKRFVLAFVVLAMSGAVFGGLTGCDTSGKTKLYFDGGGGSGNYTTTSSYDTLEELAKEWNANNDRFEIVINSASLNGNRSAITSMLTAGTAPDMLMQVGSVVNDDIGNGWYVDLTDYLDQPNPYEEGNTAWKDIYGADSIAASAASDGRNYYVCLDKIAIGMLYNMDILNAAGIEEAPETYSEFLACLKTLQQAKDAGKIDAEIFMHGGLWQESYLGNSVYGFKIEEWDEDDTGTVSTYELVKSYREGKWSLDDEYFREFLRLCYEKGQYYPDNYLSYDTNYNFARGKLAITDAVGNVMKTLTKNAKFDVEIKGYPVLDTEASPLGGYTTIRGCAGLSSAYWVTNSAVAKGQDAVDACVDFLMYLTASENNARLVNDLGYALPINVDDSTVELFDGLVAEYKEDLASGNALLWSACYIPDSLGTAFNDHYQLAMGSFYEDSDGVKTGDIDAVIEDLEKYIDDCIDALIRQYHWEF